MSVRKENLCDCFSDTEGRRYLSIEAKEKTKFKRGRKTKIKSLSYNQLYKKHEMRRDEINLLGTKMLLIHEQCEKKNKQTKLTSRTFFVHYDR